VRRWSVVFFSVDRGEEKTNVHAREEPANDEEEDEEEEDDDDEEDPPSSLLLTMERTDFGSQFMARRGRRGTPSPGLV